MNDLRLNHELNISQTLEMVLSPRMIQMLKVLNMSYTELVEQVEENTTENVMLELEKPDRLMEFLRHIEDKQVKKKDLTGEDLPGIETLSSMNESLEDHLIKQLDLEDLTEEQFSIGERIIASIDNRGYLSGYEDLAAGIIRELGTTKEEIDEILTLIQTFEPEGVGARSLKESLMIQIKEYNFDTPELEELLIRTVELHLEALANKEYEKIAKAMKISNDGAKMLAEFIKNNLNPNPGSSYAAASVCVIPSFLIKKEKGRYLTVDLEKTYGPVIKLSPAYQKMLKDPKTDKESVEFLKKKLESAKEFMENLEKRHETMQKIADMIIAQQTEFLDDPNAIPKPLMQKRIADELGLHPSTISRAISNKYIQSPKGIIQLKSLCPREVKGTTSKKIKKVIEGIISAEDKANPFTDDAISQKLKQEGIELDRRTVSTYRKKIGVKFSTRRVKS